MKNSFGCLAFVLFILLGLVILIFASCTKEYDQHPTCYKYIQLIDRFTGERDYIGTDTTYPGGKFEQVCNDDTIIFHLQPDTLGCIGGYFSYRYIKQ